MSDLISRQAALNTVQNMYDRCDTDSMQDYHDLLMEAFEILPSVQPEPQWIPCSERLPEEDGLYLVTTSKRQVQRHVFSRNGNSEEYWNRCNKAWMPVPEPWEGEQDETPDADDFCSYGVRKDEEL